MPLIIAGNEVIPIFITIYYSIYIKLKNAKKISLSIVLLVILFNSRDVSKKRHNQHNSIKDKDMQAIAFAAMIGSGLWAVERDPMQEIRAARAEAEAEEKTIEFSTLNKR
jgi:hypothetical protein